MSIPIGTKVRVIWPEGSNFYGHTGIIVPRPGRRKHKGAANSNRVQFPGHPWQEKRPSDAWFFDDAELEILP